MFLCHDALLPPVGPLSEPPLIRFFHAEIKQHGHIITHPFRSLSLTMDVGVMSVALLAQTQNLAPQGCGRAAVRLCSAQSSSQDLELVATGQAASSEHPRRLFVVRSPYGPPRSRRCATAVPRLGMTGLWNNAILGRLSPCIHYYLLNERPSLGVVGTTHPHESSLYRHIQCSSRQTTERSASPPAPSPEWRGGGGAMGSGKLK